MNLNAAPHLIPVGENGREGRRFKEPRKAIDLKVQNLVASRVNLPCVKEGILLATAVDPTEKMVVNRTAKNGEQGEWKSEKRKKSSKGIRIPLTYFPIGLRQCDSHHWVNALMQFLLFIPTFREIFSYVPKSLQSLIRFADLYFQDLEENRILSRAEGIYIADALLGKFPHLLKAGDLVMNLDDVIQCIWNSAASSKWQRPDWQLLWDSGFPFETLVSEKKEQFFEWLVTLRRINDSEARKKPHLLFEGSCLRRQYLFAIDSCVCFELDAFLEIRSEEGSRVIYFTYLKTGEGWVQCTDERIMILRRSRSLEMALQRGVLFHYKRVPLGSCSFLSN